MIRVFDFHNNRGLPWLQQFVCKRCRVTEMDFRKRPLLTLVWVAIWAQVSRLVFVPQKMSAGTGTRLACMLSVGLVNKFNQNYSDTILGGQELVGNI